MPPHPRMGGFVGDGVTGVAGVAGVAGVEVGVGISGIVPVMM